MFQRKCIGSVVTLLLLLTNYREAINFTTMSGTEMQRLAQLRLTRHDLFHVTQRTPVPYGALDKRMVLFVVAVHVNNILGY